MYHKPSGGSRALGLAFGVAGSLGLAALYPNNAAAIGSQVTANIGTNTVFVKSDSDVAVEVVPSMDGSLGVGKHTVEVATDSDTGYRLYVRCYNQAAGDCTSLKATGGGAIPSLESASGYTGAATSFKNVSTNAAWGYAVPAQSGTFTPSGDFAGMTAAGYEDVITSRYTADAAKVSALKFKGISKSWNMVASRSDRNYNSGAADFGADKIDVYYGVYVQKTSGGVMPVAEGDYTNTVMYTAFIDGSDSVDIRNNTKPNLTDTALIDGGEKMRFVTGYANSQTAVTAAQIDVKLFNNANMGQNVGTCTNIAVDSVSNGTSGHPLIFTCTYTKGGDTAVDTLYSATVDIDATGSGTVVELTKQSGWKWENRIPYSISYNANGGSGAPSAQTGKVTSGTNVTLAAQGSMKKACGTGNSVSDCFVFNGWTDSASGTTTYTQTAITGNKWDTTSKTFYAKWTRRTYTARITYNVDGGSAVSDTTKTVDYGATNTITLAAAPTKSGSTFKGWKIDGTTYSAGASVNIPEGTSFSKTATAQWEAAGLVNNGNMQDMTAAMCKSTPKYSASNTTYNLKDSRTGKSYLVRKLEDGNCWMVQNLWLEGNKTYTNGSANGNTFSTGSSSTSGWQYNSASGTQFYTGTHTDNTADSNSNTGSFFTWRKATADTGGAYGTDQAATDSVCPKGWKLPTGGSGGDFQTLYATAYSSNYSNFNAVWGGSLIGNCHGSSCTLNQGSYAYWWASTQYGSNSGHVMSMDSSSFGPTNNSNKGLGFSVRCMLSGQ